MDSQPGKALICRHIKTNGHRCQAFAIGSSAFCYFHRTLHRGHRAASAVKAAPLRPEPCSICCKTASLCRNTVHLRPSTSPRWRTPTRFSSPSRCSSPPSSPDRSSPTARAHSPLHPADLPASTSAPPLPPPRGRGLLHRSPPHRPQPARPVSSPPRGDNNGVPSQSERQNLSRTVSRGELLSHRGPECSINSIGNVIFSRNFNGWNIYSRYMRRKPNKPIDLLPNTAQGGEGGGIV